MYIKADAGPGSQRIYWGRAKMEQGMYETDGRGGLVRISTEGKNDLQPGQVLRWGGNIAAPQEDFVVS